MISGAILSFVSALHGFMSLGLVGPILAAGAVAKMQQGQGSFFARKPDSRFGNFDGPLDSIWRAITSFCMKLSCWGDRAASKDLVGTTKETAVKTDAIKVAVKQQTKQNLESLTLTLSLDQKERSNREFLPRIQHLYQTLHLHSIGQGLFLFSNTKFHSACTDEAKSLLEDAMKKTFYGRIDWSHSPTVIDVISIIHRNQTKMIADLVSKLQNNGVYSAYIEALDKLRYSLGVLYTNLTGAVRYQMNNPKFLNYLSAVLFEVETQIKEIESLFDPKSGKKTPPADSPVYFKEQRELEEKQTQQMHHVRKAQMEERITFDQRRKV